MPIDVLVSLPAGYLDGEDFRFGWSLLRSAVPGRWHVGHDEPLATLVSRVTPTLPRSADLCVLIPDPAIIVPAHCLSVLTDALERYQAPAVVAASAGYFPAEAAPDYLTLHGLERYADRCRLLPLRTFSGDKPALVVVRRFLLDTIFAPDGSWRMPQGTLLVPGAPVHLYADYHRSTRSEVLPLLPNTVSRLLDVGGGEGGFAAEAKRLRGCEVHVVEANAKAARAASERADRVWDGDFLGIAFDTQFDCVTALDMIEHCVNTEAVLAKIYSLLTVEGTFIASIPNLGHWSVLSDLLAGRWDYLPVGIACRSHLRFFTRHTIEEFWHRAGFKIAAMHPVTIPFPADSAQLLASAAAAFAVPANRESLDTYQYLVVAQRS